MSSMSKTLSWVLVVLFATCAAADPVSVTLSTPQVVAHNGTDVFDLTGNNGGLVLDNSLTTQFIVETVLYTPGSRLPDVRLFDLSYDLTIDGITHTVTQSITTTFTGNLFQDTIAASDSAPVLFDTPVGEWDVSAKGFSPVLLLPFGFTPFPVSVNFVPVPEPTSGLLGAVLVTFAMIRRRRGR